MGRFSEPSKICRNCSFMIVKQLLRDKFLVELLLSVSGLKQFHTCDLGDLDSETDKIETKTLSHLRSLLLSRPDYGRVAREVSTPQSIIT